MSIRPFVDVRSLRQSKALSQEMLATIAGVSVRSVRRMESGEMVSAETYRCVSAALDVRSGHGHEKQSVGSPPGTMVLSGESANEVISDLVKSRPPWLDVAMVAVAAIILAIGFIGGFAPMLGVAGMPVIVISAIALAAHAHTGPQGPGVQVLAFTATATLAFGFLGCTATSFHAARAAYASALALGMAGGVGILYAKAKGIRAPGRSVSVLMGAGLVLALACVPLLNLIGDWAKEPAYVERIVSAYARDIEGSAARGDLTERGKWEASRRLHADLAATPLRSVAAIQEVYVDYGAYERRSAALDACRGSNLSDVGVCRKRVFDGFPTKWVAVPFDQWDVIAGLYARVRQGPL